MSQSRIKRLAGFLALFVVLVPTWTTAQRTSNRICAPTASLVDVRLLAVSRYAACGTAGLSEAVVRAEVTRHVEGSSLPATLMLVLPCPADDLRAGQVLRVCIGEPPPTVHFHRFDDFPLDTSPRRYAQTVARILRERSRRSRR
jgi:hypothetical protein